MLNTLNDLRGKRKLNAFWLFGKILFQHLRQNRAVEPVFMVGVLFGNLRPEEKAIFDGVQDATARTRHVTFMNILRTETSLRTI